MNWIKRWLRKRLVRFGIVVLPQTEAGAMALGKDDARRGGTITENPYAGADGEYATWFKGRHPYPYLDHQAHSSRLKTHAQLLAAAYYQGFGEVIWTKMNDGYEDYRKGRFKP
jgi:hypothetical protein